MPKQKKKRDGFSFDFSSLSFGGQDEEEIKEIPRLSLKPIAFENAEAMADGIDWAKDYFAIVSGSFIFGDFIEALHFKKHLDSHAVWLTTLGMSENNVDSIVNLTQYLHVKKVNLIVSHYFAGVERHKLIPYMEREFSGQPIDVAILQSHSKIAVIESGKGDAVIAGSANLSSSNNVEQFIIMHDPTIVKWSKKKLNGIMQRFTVMRGMDGAKMNWGANKNNTGKYAYDALTKEGD